MTSKQERVKMSNFTKENKAKVALIGLGVMGQRHARAISMLENGDFYAICDLNEEALKTTQDKYNVQKTFTSWQDMLQNEDLDLLVISTHGPLHAEMVLAAAEVKVPRILSEKPMATSLADCEKMIKACEANSVKLTVNHSRRWHKPYQELKQVLADGVIGDIRHITFEMAGGQMASNGGHFWDLARFLTGKEPVQAFGYLDKTGTKNPRGAQYNDPGAYGIVKFEDNIRIFFDMCEDYGVPFFMEIMGSVGRVVIDEKMNKWEISARSAEDRDQPMTRRPALVPVAFEGQPVNMISCCVGAMEELLSDQASSCDGADGMKSVEITVAMHESEKRGNQVVSFPLSEEARQVGYSFT